MKSPILAAIFTAILLSVPSSHAETPENRAQPERGAAARQDITICGTVISLPNAEAVQFSAKQDLSGKPAEALNALEKLVAQKKATPVAIPSITTMAGSRAVSDSGKVTFEAEPTVSPDGKFASIQLNMNDNGHAISTSFTVANGGVKFLGSVQSPTDKTKTDYLFVRVSY